jgi:hypothetical protein
LKTDFPKLLLYVAGHIQLKLMMDGKALKQVVRNSSLKSFKGENYMDQKTLTGKKITTKTKI